MPGVGLPKLGGLRLRLTSASTAMARAQQSVTRAGTLALSPTRWWTAITSATGVAALLALSVVGLIAGLVVTLPHH